MDNVLFRSKRIHILIICSLLILSPQAIAAVSGDVDESGQVNAVDVQLVINAALGIDIGPYNADINGDGAVNAVDVQLVINIALGIDTGGEDVFYVSPSGNDIGSGAETDAWRTIQHAANTLEAGQTVYIMEGVYEERVIPQRSGTPGNYIVYAANPGDTPTIDGANISLPDDLVGLFEVTNRQYIRVSGLRIINAGPNDNDAGIMVNESDHIIIENNKTFNTVSSGIGVWGSTNITIDGNEVELACNDGEQECITVAQTDIFEISNNNVHHNGPGTIGGEGIDAKDGCSNGTIHHNYVHDLNARLGIYMEAWDKHTFNIDVFQNVVGDIFSADGISVASEMGGVLENVRIFNNVVYRAGCNGISVARNGDSPQHPLKDISIINNTLYDNGSASCYGGEWGGAISIDNPDTQNLVVRNNLCSQNLLYQIEVELDIPPGSYTIDHNLIYPFRDELTEETRGDNFVEADPQLVDPANLDLHLKAGSPAIDAGSATAAPEDDLDGVTRPQGPAHDIGAFEYTSAR